MSTTTLPNIRVSSDLTVRVRLKDGDVAIDWSTLNNIKAHIYSDAQRALAGRCDVSVDAEDSTLLVCNYAANKPQYVGINRIVVSAKYMGETKTYDKPAFNFVRWTADQEGEEITIDDPDVDVEIEVEDVTSSILQEAIDAALQAAADAEHAAHLVPLEVLQDCEQATADALEAAATANAAGIDEVQATVDAQVGTPSVDVDLENKVLSLDFHNMKGETGEAAGFGTASASLTEDGGDPGVTVSASGSDTAKNFAFTFKNLKGDKGDKGDQGNTGSSVEYPYELVNNLTTNDATKGLTAAMGVTLEGEVSQLEAKVDYNIEGNLIFGKAIDTTGAEITDAAFLCTDKILVSSGNVVSWLCGENTDYSLVAYNSSDTKLDFWRGGTSVRDLTMPNGTAYIRATFKDGADYFLKLNNQSIIYCGLKNEIERQGLDKVDKENGKSLIDSDFAESVSFVESPEYIDATVDKDGVILEATKANGAKVIKGGIEIGGRVDVPGSSLTKIDNPEWVKVIVDSEGRVLCGIDNEGKVVAPNGIKGVSDKINEIEGKLGYYENIKNAEAANVLRRFVPFSVGTPSTSLSIDNQYERTNILFFTDSHIDLTNPEQSLENVADTISFAKNAGVRFDAIIHAGDIITPFGVFDKTSQKAKAKKVFDIFKQSESPVIFSVGNHDTNDWGNYVSNAFNDADWGEMWYNFAEKRYGIVRQLKQSGDKSTWHYYDVVEKKIRIICIDVQDCDKSIGNENNKVIYYGGVAWYISNEQFNWVSETALNFDDKSEKDWGVIIVSHQGTRYGVSVRNPNNFSPVSDWVSGANYVVGNLVKYSGVNYRCITANNDETFVQSKWKETDAENDIAKFSLMLKAFNEQSTYNEDYTFSGDSFYNLSVHADWTRYANLEKKPYIVCWLLGHEHFDQNTIENGINMIWTANGAASSVSSDARVARVINTPSQNLFDLISIDKSFRRIRYIRYGAGVNCYGVGGDRFVPDGLNF